MNSGWMFYRLPRDIAGRRDLPASAKVLLAVLIDRIGQNSCCWPGIRCLAKDSGLSIPAVVRGLACLEAKKLVEIERRNNGHSNRYRVPMCTQFVNTGANEPLAEALTKRAHNQKDQLNQTHINNCPSSESFRRIKKTSGYGKHRPRYNRDFASQESSIGTVIAM